MFSPEFRLNKCYREYFKYKLNFVVGLVSGNVKFQGANSGSVGKPKWHKYWINGTCQHMQSCTRAMRWPQVLKLVACLLRQIVLWNICNWWKSFFRWADECQPVSVTLQNPTIMPTFRVPLTDLLCVGSSGGSVFSVSRANLRSMSARGQICTDTQTLLILHKMQLPLFSLKMK